MYYLMHIVIQHRCYQLNDQDIVCGMWNLTEMKERKNVLELGNGTTYLSFSKQRLQCTTLFTYQLFTSTFIINHSPLGNI